MAATALLASSAAMSTEILISLVAIIWMLMFASPSASNIWAATPAWVSIPAPTMDTLATSRSQTTLLSPRVPLRSSSRRTVSSASFAATVKEMSWVPSRPTDWRMMSMLILFFASSENSLKAMPGWSETPMAEIRAMFTSFVTPLISSFSTSVTSLTMVPSAPVMLERTSRLTLYFFAISTERLCSTLAPREASSSISS